MLGLLSWVNAVSGTFLTWISWGWILCSGSFPRGWLMADQPVTQVEMPNDRVSFGRWKGASTLYCRA